MNDTIKIIKYYGFKDEDETIKVYDTESIREEFEEKMKELEAHNETEMEK